MPFLVGKDTKFQVTISSTLTDVPNLISIDPPTTSFDAVENYVMGGSYKSSRASGVQERSETTIEYYETPDNAVHEFIRNNVGGDAIACAIEWSNGDSETFSAWIMSRQNGNTTKDDNEVSCKVVFVHTTPSTAVEAS